MNQKKMMVILFLFGFILGAITCSDKEFQCGNGKCINVAKQCDGYPDCLDKSDEIDRCGAECVLNDLKKFLFKDEPIKAVYRNGDKIQIYCPMDLAYGYAYYDEETSAELTCKNGSWVGNVPQCISNQDSNIKSTPGADLDTVTNPGEVDTTQHVMAGSTSYIDSEFRSVRDDEITPNPNIGSKNTTEELLTNKATCQLDGLSQYLMKNQLPEKLYRHGQNIIITCPHSDDHEYDYDQLSDDSRSELTCHDGQWIGSYPGCFKGCRSKVVNDFLVEEQNIIDEYRSGEIISVSCFRKSSESQIGKNIWGYESDNQTRADMIRNLICLNGQWVGEYPECFALCRRSSIQGNLMKETESEYFLPGDVVQIKICWGNIPVEGDGHLTCMANGSWYGNASCPPQSVLDCVPPHDIQNAYISGSHWDRYPEGSVIIYKCSQSYWLRGDNKVKCINGKWTEKQFHCEIRTCQYPGEIENGQILNNSVKVGQHIHFRCDEGYTLKGPNMMLCYADGNFHLEIMPACEAVQCQPLRPPDNGWIDHYEVSNGRVSNNYGNFVRIRCKHGYQLIGSERRQCQADMTWSGEEAICQRQRANCYKIPVVPGAKLEGQQKQWYIHGSNISYSCMQNYILRGSRHFSCDDGQWMGGGFNCTTVQCQPLKPPDNGWIDHYEVSDGRASNNYGSFVRIRCMHGYQLIGSERRQCQSDMTWSGEDAVCQRQRANCYKIPVVPGAKLEGQQKQWYIHGSNISYSCMQNYILRGSRHFSCDDGQWMGGGFNCTTVQCQPLKPPDNGWIDHYEVSDGRASNNYGSFVRIRCMHGYQLIGSERRQCQSDMTWSGEDAVCQRQRANCYKIPVVPGAKLEGQQKQWYIHGSNISYSCMQNYILRGSRHFSCDDGQWMGGGFNCTSPVCKLSPLDLRYGRFSGVDPMTIVHGDRISIRETITCNDGYTVHPNISYISCYNGTLDPLKFDCVKYDDSISSCHLSNYEGKVIRYKDKCYLATDSTFMYRHYGGIHKDAGSFCRNLGSNAYLAIIPDKETNEAVRYLINLVHGEHKYWFGAQWNSYKSRWMWHNEIPLNYTNWKSGDGSKTAHVKSQDCAVFTSDGRWEDTVCWKFGTTDKKYKAVCEIAVNW
ncbi:hypothetical protein ACJMK2_040063 [Sinanodonta woodiana]|uniref:Uncharacterized protein n=1 Tax=Sinanodonta woodiana TaxID=1069815 RepID=A0ABD3WFE7_SINWO